MINTLPATLKPEVMARLIRVQSELRSEEAWKVCEHFTNPLEAYGCAVHLGELWCADCIDSEQHLLNRELHLDVLPLTCVDPTCTAMATNGDAWTQQVSVYAPIRVRGENANPIWAGQIHFMNFTVWCWDHCPLNPEHTRS